MSLFRSCSLRLAAALLLGGPAGAVPPAVSPPPYVPPPVQPSLRAPTLGDDYTAGYTAADGVGAIIVTAGGSGYTTAPSVAISGTGTGAAAHALVVAGVIVKIVVDNPGTGYTTAPSITLAGAGTGATVVAHLGLAQFWNAPSGVYQAIRTVGGAAWQRAAAAAAYPVDAVGGTAPVAAYGTRRLRAAWSGNAVDVVCNSATYSIGFRADGSLDTATLDADCGANTPRISKWYDQSGNGNDAVQPTAANQPTIQATNTIGATRSVLFDTCPKCTTPTTEQLNIPTTVAPSTNAMSFFALMRAVSGSNKIGIVDWTASTPQYLGFATGNILGLFDGVTFRLDARLSVSPMLIGYAAGAAAGATVVVAGGSRANYGSLASAAVSGGSLGASSHTGGSGYLEMVAAVAYGRTLSGAEQTALQASLQGTFGVYPQTRNVILWDGDSITEGYGSSFGLTYPRQVEPLLSMPARAYNIAVFGDQIEAQTASFPANALPAFNYAPAARNNVLSFFCGTNNINNTDTDATTETKTLAYVAQARALGPSNLKIIVGTMLPRSTFSATQEGYRQAFNTWLRANWPSFADGLADYAADPTMGASTAPSNTLLYVDGTHPTTLGYSYVAAVNAAAINALLQ